MKTVQELVEAFDLKPHPEGGYFKETYRGPGKESLCTSIYYLLPEGEKSHFHRIKSDEIWHFYGGGTFELLEINSDGALVRTLLGTDFKQGEKFQHVVLAGNWFAGTPLKGSGYSFFGCTVAPGFEFTNFELANSQKMMQNYPHLQSTIAQFT